MKKYSGLPGTLVVSGLALFAAGVAAASASDKSKDVAVRVKAPLEAAACTTAPPTITVLGLNIDTTKAIFEAEGEDDDHGGVSSGTCSGLVVGSPVEVKLVDDVEPLAATEVGQEGDDDDDGMTVQAPLQAVDPGARTITLLGLTIDASAAGLEGDDDDCEDGGAQPLDLGQLTVGQFVEVHLDSSRLPALVATRLEVKNFANQIEVEVDDENGVEVDDDSPSVSVDAAVTVAVRTPAHKGHPARVFRKTVRITKLTNGRFVLSGLPKGVATIKVSRDVGGVNTAARRAVRVQPNRTRTVKLRLHKTHAK